MLCWHFWHQYGLFTHHLKAKLNPSVSLAPHYVCFDLGFTLEKNLTSSVSLLPPARGWGSFSWEMAPSTGELHTLNFPLLLCSPCPHMRMEQPSMKGLWQLHLGMRSHFTMVAAELARTFSPLLQPCPDSLAGAVFAWASMALPSPRWGCLPRLVLCVEHCLWQRWCVGIFFSCLPSLDTTPSGALCWKHCWVVQFMNVIMCAESSLFYFIRAT